MDNVSWQTSITPFIIAPCVTSTSFHNPYPHYFNLIFNTGTQLTYTHYKLMVFFHFTATRTVHIHVSFCNRHDPMRLTLHYLPISN